MTIAAPRTLLFLSSCLVIAACSGDDEASGSDTAATATTVTTTTVTATGTMSGTATMSGTGTESDSDTGSGSASATTSTTTDPTDSTTVTSETTVSETMGTTTGVVTDSDSDTSGTTGPDCVYTCSDDLTQVLCDGVPTEDCGAQGQYCAAGECIDSPCEATKKAQSSEGCEFWAVKTGLIAEAAGSCFAAFLANTGDEPAHIQVEYQGQQLPVESFARIPTGQGNNIVYSPYDANAGLPPGEVAILFLSRGPGGFPTCPGGLAAVPQETHVADTGRGNAFHISTDYPVAAYQMLPYGGGAVAATSATLLLPVGTWDVNYIAVNAYPKSQAVPQANPIITLVGNEDNTKLTIDPKVAIVGGNGVDPAAANMPHDYFLNRGETIQISQPQELTGSPILGDKPFLLFGGATCLNVPVSAIACDGAHQQIPPVKALGSAYTAIRYRNRGGQEETPPWRLVGAVNGTNLTWFNKPAGAPDSLALGQVAEFTAAGPFAVSSQDDDHPFYLAAYMTGGQPFNGTGDPEWVNVVPSAQYLRRYVLFTDPTYPETSLVVVRSPDENNNFADVNLGCLGPLTGWMPVGDKEYTRVNLVTGNFQDVGNCSNGRHEMSSDNPFGVTVWGWGSMASQFNSIYVSYAYPAGASVKAINDVEVLPQ